MKNISFDQAINSIPFAVRPGRLEVNGKGHLQMEGRDLCELAQRYGTPLFVFSERALRENYRRMRQILNHCFERAEICFAYKSNSLLSVLRVLKEEGAWADVVSGGEYYKALRAGVPREHIVFNGNNKKRQELEEAIAGGTIINVDSTAELSMVEEIAGRLCRKARINIRVNADVSPDIIPEFSTALKASKFGVDLDGEAFAACRLAAESEHIEILGLHSHIGSQIEDSRCYRYAALRIMDFAGRLKKELGLELSYVNMGGGFGVPFDYLEGFEGGGDFRVLEEFAQITSEVFCRKVKEHGLKMPRLMVEPGASLVGTCAVTLMRVGTVKQKAAKKLAALDGGADTLLRAAQGWYTYRALCAGGMNRGREEAYDLVGPLCYEGDILARDRMLCRLEEGDIIAFVDTGAYTTSLLNNYNGKTTAAVLMLEEKGGVKVIKRRQTLEELLLGEI